MAGYLFVCVCDVLDVALFRLSSFFLLRSVSLSAIFCNPLWTLEQELSEKIIPSTTHWILFFNFSFFFVPSLKRRLIPLFVPVFLLCHLLVSLFRCAYIRSFLCYKFFFAFPQIRHSGFGRFHQSSDALVGILWEYG